MMSVAHSASTTTLLVRVLVAFALTFVLGFERELRGSPAGDRTFSLIGTASAVLGNLAGAGSPNAIAGAVTAAPAHRRWSPDFQHDADLDRDDDRAVLPDATASPDDDQQSAESR